MQMHSHSKHAALDARRQADRSRTCRAIGIAILFAPLCIAAYKVWSL